MPKLGGCPKCGGALFTSAYEHEESTCIQCGYIVWADAPAPVDIQALRDMRGVGGPKPKTIYPWGKPGVATAPIGGLQIALWR